MLLSHYRHRLPADYEMGRIRERVAARGSSWDATPGLGFKAFCLSDRENGAAANVYASLYLWLDPRAAVDFLADARFASVVASFGRPRIATWLPFDVRLGRAKQTRFLQREDVLLGPDTDLARRQHAEAEHGSALARSPDVLATVVGLDPQTWRLTRFTLTTEAPPEGEALDVMHLAAPGLATLRETRSD